MAVPQTGLTDAERTALVRKVQDMAEQLQNVATLLRSREPEWETLRILENTVMNMSLLARRLSRVKAGPGALPAATADPRNLCDLLDLRC